MSLLELIKENNRKTLDIPSQTPTASWSEDQWRDFTSFVEVLETHPHLWSAVGSFAYEILHPELYLALEREGYEHKRQKVGQEGCSPASGPAINSIF